MFTTSPLEYLFYTKPHIRCHKGNLYSLYHKLCNMKSSIHQSQSISRHRTLPFSHIIIDFSILQITIIVRVKRYKCVYTYVCIFRIFFFFGWLLKRSSSWNIFLLIYALVEKHFMKALLLTHVKASSLLFLVLFCYWRKEWNTFCYFKLVLSVLIVSILLDIDQFLDFKTFN